MDYKIKLEALKRYNLAIADVEKLFTEEVIAATPDLTTELFDLIARNASRRHFFNSLRNGIVREMRKFAEAGYIRAKGVHLPIDSNILDKAIKTQIGYANRFESSGDELNPVRVGMYAREAEHIAQVVGMQQAMKERGAKLWRRVLHPELSKTGPCPQCAADANLVHPIDMPFFEFHPNGVCSAQSMAFETETGAIDMPIPEENPQGFLEHLKELFENIKSIVRRVRR